MLTPEQLALQSALRIEDQLRTEVGELELRAESDQGLMPELTALLKRWRAAQTAVARATLRAKGE